MEIVPARPEDWKLITDEVTRMRLDPENLGVEQFVVALEEDEVVGFGRIKPYGDGVFELGCVGVLPIARSHGLGAAIIEELIRRFPTDDVYITTDLVEYFTRFGFSKTANAPAAIVAKVQRVAASALRSGVVAMAMNRSRR